MPRKDCPDILKRAIPELHQYIEQKAGAYDGTPEAKEKWKAAAIELQRDTLDSLHNVYNEIGLPGYDKPIEKIIPVENEQNKLATEAVTKENTQNSESVTTESAQFTEPSIDQTGEAATEKPSIRVTAEQLKFAQPKDTDQVGGKKYPSLSLNYTGTQDIENQYGLQQRTPTQRKRDAETIAEADDLLSKGWDVQDALNRTEKEGYAPSDAEYINITRYAAELDSRLRGIKNINSKEYNDTLNELNRVAKLSEASGQRQGRDLSIRGRFRAVADGTYGDFMLSELAANNEAPLTEQQKETAQKDFDTLKSKEKTYEEKYSKLQDEVNKTKAQEEVTKAAPAEKSKKTHEDFVAERKKYLEAAREALKKLRTGESGLSAVPLPGVRELIAIAPHVQKALRSLAEEGITKLEEVVKILHDTFVDAIDGLTEKHIRDIIAGEYNERRPTKKEHTIDAENLRIQAQLMNKLDKLVSGEEPKSETQKRKRNQDIERLRDQISGFREEEREAKKAPDVSDNAAIKKALEALIERNQTKADEIRDKISKGDFSEPQKVVPLLQRNEVRKQFPELFKEALKSKDELVKAKQDIELRRLKQMYENKSGREKINTQIVRALNVPRTLMASMDFSAPLRQGIVASIAHPVFASKAAKFMFQAAADKKVYNRWLSEAHESPRWDTSEKSGLAVTDPTSLHLKNTEEAFLGAPLAEKIPIAGAVVKASERAYIGFLNKIRWDLFNHYADIFESKGKTFENNPELYKGLASYINNSTGRGGLGFAESAGPLLNSFLFAPKLIAARFNMLGLGDLVSLGNGFYGKLPKEVRVLAMRDMLRFIAGGIGVLALAKYGFGLDVEVDPRSSDFGKIRSGNTRWDIWGGFQPYVRVITQVATGQRKSTNTGKVYELDGEHLFGQERTDPLVSFGRGKLAPIPALTWDLLSGRTGIGQKIEYNIDMNDNDNKLSLANEAARYMLPLIGQDVADAMKDQGIKALFTAGVPAAFGVGVNTYEPKQTKDRKRVNQ